MLMPHYSQLKKRKKKKKKSRCQHTAEALLEGCRGALVGPGAVDENHCATWLLEVVMLT